MDLFKKYHYLGNAGLNPKIESLTRLYDSIPLNMLYEVSGRTPSELCDKNRNMADYLLDIIDDKGSMNLMELTAAVLADSQKANKVLKAPGKSLTFQINYMWKYLIKNDILIEASEEVSSVTGLVEESNILFNSN